MAAGANTAIAAIGPTAMTVVHPGPVLTWQQPATQVAADPTAGAVLRVVKIATSQASSW